MKNKNKYPLKDGHRLHYVWYPTLKNGLWYAADVQITGGYSIPSDRIGLVSQSACQKACSSHNNYHGWTPVEAIDIVNESMNASEKKINSTKRLYGIQASAKDIGKHAKCFDNSYAINILDNTEADVTRKKITITSTPFTVQVTAKKGKPIPRECILVSSKNETYRVLNSFREIVNLY